MTEEKTNKKNTLVVNLFGSQGTGKSTMMAGIFSRLKFLGYDCEMCPEFAKELVWENRMETFSDELYLFAKQNHRLFRLNGKVDIVITDRPLYMSIPYYRYYKGENKTYEKLVKETFDSYRNLNIFLKRCKPFNPNGRNETEEQSNEFAHKLWKSLIDDKVVFTQYDGRDDSIEDICDLIIKVLQIGQDCETVCEKVNEPENGPFIQKSSHLTWFEEDALNYLVGNDPLNDDYGIEVDNKIQEKLLKIINSNVQFYDLNFNVIISYDTFQKMVSDKLKLDGCVDEEYLQNMNLTIGNECMVNFVPIATLSDGTKYGMLKKCVTISPKSASWIRLYNIAFNDDGGKYPQIFAGFCK